MIRLEQKSNPWISGGTSSSNNIDRIPNPNRAGEAVNVIGEYIDEIVVFDVNVCFAVRIDQISARSFGMYVRVFTKTNSWYEMLSVNERLAIEIKQIVENNKAAFAFPSQSIYIEKK